MAPSETPRAGLPETPALEHAVRRTALGGGIDRDSNTRSNPVGATKIPSPRSQPIGDGQSFVHAEMRTRSPSTMKVFPTAWGRDIMKLVPEPSDCAVTMTPFRSSSHSS